MRHSSDFAGSHKTVDNVYRFFAHGDQLREELSVEQHNPRSKSCTTHLYLWQTVAVESSNEPWMRRRSDVMPKSRPKVANALGEDHPNVEPNAPR